MNPQRPHSKSHERQSRSRFEVQLKEEKEMSDQITFGTFGRYTEIPVDQMTPEQKKGYEYVVKERGEAPDRKSTRLNSSH